MSVFIFRLAGQPCLRRSRRVGYRCQDAPSGLRRARGAAWRRPRVSAAAGWALGGAGKGLPWQSCPPPPFTRNSVPRGRAARRFTSFVTGAPPRPPTERPRPLAAQGQQGRGCCGRAGGVRGTVRLWRGAQGKDKELEKCRCWGGNTGWGPCKVLGSGRLGNVGTGFGSGELVPSGALGKKSPPEVLWGTEMLWGRAGDTEAPPNPRQLQG